ncbi:MAG: hypothetical protein NZ809_03110 [Thermodesulfovibrio sp.]|nr:hypothetical protein [Thermodesulfovibrio sp.]
MKAYINIEGDIVKLLISSGKNIEYTTLSKNELLGFLKQKKIKKVVISQFYPELLSIKIPIPFTEKPLKSKKIIEGLIKTELIKRFRELDNISYQYEIVETEARAWIRVYLISDKELETINSLILNDIEIIGNYPTFMILRAFVSSLYKFDTFCQLICLVSDKRRYLFLFYGKEMVFQRGYESEETALNSDDIININMTISYSIQNLRLNPEKLIFIGVEPTEISGISVSSEFLNIDKNLAQPGYLVTTLLKEFEKKLKGKEFLSKEYKSFSKTKLSFKYAFFTAFLLLAVSSVYATNMLVNVLEKSKEISFYKKEISHKEKMFFTLKRTIEEFERSSKPALELYAKKVSYPDVRILLNSVGIASSKFKQAQIDSVEIENVKPPKIKISGKIFTDSFSERQEIYMNFKMELEKENLKISQEKWDFMKGEYSVEAIYETKRVF